MQTLYVNDPKAVRRRVPLTLFANDGLAPAAGEANNQPVFYVNGALVGNTGGLLVAVDASRGMYYVELSQANLAGLAWGDKVRVTYDSANTLPEDVTCAVDVLPFLDEGAAQGGSLTGITLQPGASSVDDTYVGATLWIYDGTGAGQVRDVGDYAGASRVATPTVPFLVAPDGTSQYLLFAQSPTVDLGKAVLGTQRADVNVAGSWGAYMNSLAIGSGGEVTVGGYSTAGQTAVRQAVEASGGKVDATNTRVVAAHNTDGSFTTAARASIQAALEAGGGYLEAVRTRVLAFLQATGLLTTTGAGSVQGAVEAAGGKTDVTNARVTAAIGVTGALTTSAKDSIRSGVEASGGLLDQTLAAVGAVNTNVLGVAEGVLAGIPGNESWQDAVAVGAGDTTFRDVQVRRGANVVGTRRITYAADGTVIAFGPLQ